jgi:2-oxoisovalerate dehydrogenase E1 component
MLAIREMEEMIVRLRSGGYEPLPGYDYRGPTHVSIGQEASPVGTCTALRADDNITSSHRGHGDAIAKGFAAIRTMTDEQLRARVPGSTATTRADLLEAALEEHVYRVIAELFGKDEGYCRGRGGGMHIGDFSTGNLGANAIVGGSVPIATGATSRATRSCAASRATARTPTASCSSRSTGPRRRSGRTISPRTVPTACRSSTSSRTTTTA